MTHERQQLIDTSSAVDIGLGYSLAYAVDGDGIAWPVLWDRRVRKPQWIPRSLEDYRDLAPHELPGRLPAAFEQFHCGARAHSGRPCRARVSGPGERCRHHPETPPATPAPVTPPAAGHDEQEPCSEQLEFDLGRRDRADGREDRS